MNTNPSLQKHGFLSRSLLHSLCFLSLDFSKCQCRKQLAKSSSCSNKLLTEECCYRNLQTFRYGTFTDSEGRGKKWYVVVSSQLFTVNVKSMLWQLKQTFSWFFDPLFIYLFWFQAHRQGGEGRHQYGVIQLPRLCWEHWHLCWCCYRSHTEVWSRRGKHSLWDG